MVMVVLAGAFCPLGATVVVNTTVSGRITMENGAVKIVLQSGPRGCTEECYAWSSSWHLILRSGSSLREDPAIKSNGGIVPLSYAVASIVSQSPKKAIVAVRGKTAGHTVIKTITMEDGKPYIQYEIQDRIGGVAELSYLMSTYSYVPEGRLYREYAPIDFVWTPQLRPDSSDVIGDHTFRSPALILQKGMLCAAMIPDVERIQPWRSMKTSADLEVVQAESPMMSYGAMNWATRSHVFYTHADAMTTLLENTSVSYGYYLYLNAAAIPREGFRDVVRFQWENTGRMNFLKNEGPQSEPFSSYIRKAWKDYLPAIALDTVYQGKPMTLLRQQRLAWSNGLPPAADNDTWFNVWFNALRSAYGMYLYGQQINDVMLTGRAEGVLNLALSAPQRNGIAPSIFYFDSTGGHWVNDHGWGGINGGKNYAMFHNAWTNYWLLRWSDLVPRRRDEILSRAGAFAAFLVSQMRPSGVVPSWYDPETVEPVEVFRDENAETAGAALFLAEFATRTRQLQYGEAAEKAMDYIRRQIVPDRKWFDFETFFSCSRKPVGFFDRFTQQHPQNTLSIHQAAEACLALYRLTGKGEYRELGVTLIDYLCLYQQVWSPQWLSRNLFGGFGVQNTDGEWSDSRQGYFAVTLMDYYDLTGEREYFERGVAALRAMFSLFESPSSPRTAENYAHSATDRPGGVTGFHWGTGSSVVSIHLLRQRYGDVFVDVKNGWGCGIDGCRVPDVAAAADTISLEIRDVVSSHRKVLTRFVNLNCPAYSVLVNGHMLGRYASAKLKEGIEIEL